MTTLLQLFWSFVKIGFTSFGGMSMIPLINSEMVSHGWMNAEEVSDIVAIAEMTPGPIGQNSATFAGLRTAGFLGSLCSNLGVMLPTFTLCALAAVFFEKFKNSSWLKNMMVGVRPASLGIVTAVLISMCGTNYIVNDAVSLPAILVGVVAFVLLLKFKWSVPKVIVLCAVLGLILL